MVALLLTWEELSQVVNRRFQRVFELLDKTLSCQLHFVRTVYNIETRGEDIASHNITELPSFSAVFFFRCCTTTTIVHA